MKPEIIEAIANAGFDVWMRDQNDSYLYFTNAEGGIGYMQIERLSGGVSLSTVHKPNTTTGTGFRVIDAVSRFDARTLSEAFITCPGWARHDVDTIKKYRDFEEFRSRDSFNAAFYCVAKGRA